MKKSIMFLIVLIIVAIKIEAQDIIIFSDSPTNTSYDPSWGFVNAPSTLELVGEKFPVDEQIKYKGLNSLVLNWNSASGGDWAVAAAAAGWPGNDATSKDSLTFWIYSENEVASINLPKIFLEDLSNKKTEKQSISEFVTDMSLSVWNKVSIPIENFANASGEADLTRIKTVFFAQGTSDNNDHKIYIDEIRMVEENTEDNTPPAIPNLLYAKGYYKHIDLKWGKNSEDDLSGYYIYKFNGDNPELISSVDNEETFYTDFLGVIDETSEYAITAFDYSGNESELSRKVSASTKNMTDEEMLTMLQEATFRYFWDYAHPISGLTRERSGSKNTVTSGGSGMGIMAIIVGVERGFITREEAANRLLKIVRFLKDTEKFHGAWPHWLNGETGKALPFSTYDDGGDLVETAYLVAGLLTARQYFDNNNSIEDEIRSTATLLWEEVEWDWYRRNENGMVLFWHWSPKYEWQMNMPIKGFNETMITYLLAIASPTHSVPANLYHIGWAGSNYKNGKSFYDITLDVGPDYGGPLFFQHYSFLGFDPRNKRDNYTNYFEHARNVSLVHYEYAIDNPKGFVGYDAKTWGLTASDDPLVGYTAHEPMNNDNGTITPTAALSSFPFTPEESMGAFKNFYNNYGQDLWGSYGFKDAFNPKLNWTAGSFLAIDQGPILIMIENYRSNLIWNLFMSNPEIAPMLDSIGFEIVNSVEDKFINYEFDLYNNFPNPFNPETIIEYSLPQSMDVNLSIFNLLGQKVATLVNQKMDYGKHKIVWNAEGFSSGIYFSVLSCDKNFHKAQKMVLLR